MTATPDQKARKRVLFKAKQLLDSLFKIEVEDKGLHKEPRVFLTFIPTGDAFVVDEKEAALWVLRFARVHLVGKMKGAES